MEGSNTEETKTEQSSTQSWKSLCFHQHRDDDQLRDHWKRRHLIQYLTGGDGVCYKVAQVRWCRWTSYDLGDITLSLPLLRVDGGLRIHRPLHTHPPALHKHPPSLAVSINADYIGCFCLNLRVFPLTVSASYLRCHMHLCVCLMSVCVSMHHLYEMGIDERLYFTTVKYLLMNDRCIIISTSTLPSDLPS